jgi:hypothetical protein
MAFFVSLKQQVSFLLCRHPGSCWALLKPAANHCPGTKNWVMLINAFVALDEAHVCLNLLGSVSSSASDANSWFVGVLS